MTTKSRSFVKKFFWEGQALEEELIENDAIEEFLQRYRKYLSVLIPVIITEFIWLLTAYRYGWFSLFATKWPICLLMIFGALVAGATSAGGGAVAFPVMTLALKILPAHARDFCVIIQSIGMSCASFSILYMNVQIEKSALIFACFGSIPGFLFGSYMIDPFLTPAEKKMLFVSIWGSFAISLYALNSQKNRIVVPKADISGYGWMILVVGGFAGGCFTSFAGSGVDIALFCVLTLFFRVSEKTATPTTVLAMALNSVVAVYFRAIWKANITPDSWDYVKVCVPVVVIFAPLGSFLGSHFHRKTLAWAIYLLEGAAVIGFLITRPSCELVIIGGGMMVTSYFFFWFFIRMGTKRLERAENDLPK